jgi:type I restriction enzyme S subunit
LIAEGTIKKTKPISSITEKEKQFELLQGWEWARLKDIVHILGDGLHRTPQYTPNTGCYFVNGNNLQNGLIVIKHETKTVSVEEIEKFK